MRKIRELIEAVLDGLDEAMDDLLPVPQPVPVPVRVNKPTGRG